MHGHFDSGWHMPLVYGLLPGKTEVLYTDFFDHLDSLAQSDPQSILCDYEKGLHNALHSIVPSATIRGCYFHFKQALGRKMQAFELVPEYKVLASPVRKWFKIIGALPFVEPSTVDVWPDIVNSVPSEMHEFISYFERTWLGSPSTVPIFDRFLWTQFDSVLAGLPRSNNIVEVGIMAFSPGWHFKPHALDISEENLTFAKRVKMRMNEQPEPKATN